METLAEILKGGDLRMLKGADEVIARVRTQVDFDALFKLLFHHDRRVVMRAADAIEKITRMLPAYLEPHESQLLELSKDHATIEVKWHLAQLLPRLVLDAHQRAEVWKRLSYWVGNRNESKIVRVNALQGMFDLMQRDPSPSLKEEFRALVYAISNEHIPSIDARIRKLRAAVTHHKGAQRKPRSSQRRTTTSSN